MVKPPAPRHGFCREGTGGTWHLWAPRARQVDLTLLDDDGRRHLPLEPGTRGWFSLHLDQVAEGQRYLFRLDRQRELPDPASRWQPDGVHGPSAVWSPQSCRWNDAAWRGLPMEQLLIYELHVGTFTSQGTFQAIIARLPELQELGINCLELMPVAQFPGHRGWGYDGVFPFAAFHGYGGPASLAALVDACHAHGLAVLLDVVYNHLGPEGNYLNAFGPYFTGKYHTPWGDAWNYDDRGADGVRQYVLDNVRGWLSDFHFDGLRLDAIQCLIDTSATHILRQIQQVADEESARQNKSLVVIGECDQNDARVLDPPQLRGYGLSAQWNDDLHHSLHALLTGERDAYYVDYGSPEELLRCLNQNFAFTGHYSRFRQRTYGAPAAHLDGSRFVVYLQNHDQVGNRPLGDRLTACLSPEQLRLAAAVVLLSPFVPLLFMGEEYGETRAFPFFCEMADRRAIDGVRRGRREQFSYFPWPQRMPDPFDVASHAQATLSWQWPAETGQAGLRRWYRDLVWSRRLLPPLASLNCRQANWHPARGSADAACVGKPAVAAQTITPAKGSGTIPATEVGHRGVLELRRWLPEDEPLPWLTAYFNFNPAEFRLPIAPEGLVWLRSHRPEYAADPDPTETAVERSLARTAPNDGRPSAPFEPFDGRLLPWEVVLCGPTPVVETTVTDWLAKIGRMLHPTAGTRPE